MSPQYELVKHRTVVLAGAAAAVLTAAAARLLR